MMKVLRREHSRPHIYRIRKKLNSVGAKNYKINNIDNSYILSVDKVN